jgi:DNA-binding cell septation regulator SpoVG
MISVLNWKEFDRGAIKGFFDLRYHGLTIKGCRLMDGGNGLWFAFPQKQGEQEGEVKYFDQMFLTSPERDHVRRLVIADLTLQGHLSASPDSPVESGCNRQLSSQPRHRTPEGEELTEHYTTHEDEIPF